MSARLSASSGTGIGWEHLFARHCRRYERGVSAVPDQSPTNDPMAAFGPNEWLVDELYEQYKNDKNSVDKVWWSLFEDYQPGGDNGANGAAANGATTSAQAPAAPAPAPAAQAPAAQAPAAPAAAPAPPAPPTPAPAAAA